MQILFKKKYQNNILMYEICFKSVLCCFIKTIIDHEYITYYEYLVTVF